MKKYLLECAVWEFTLKCNLKCLHCGSSAGASRGRELDENEALQLCYDLKDAGCLSVALMGGEPFLRPDFWRVAEKIKELGMDLSVISNGTVYNSETFKKLKKLSPRAVAVSLDGAEKETHEKIRGVPGCYEKSWNFIESALREGLPVSVITSVSKLNISELGKLGAQLKGRNIAWQIQTVGSEGERFPKELLLDREEFYSVGMFVENLRRTCSPEELPVIGAHDLGYHSGILKNTGITGEWPGCQAGISVLGIRSNGDFLGCLSINNDAFIEGNAREIKIKDLWNSEKAFQYSRNFKKADAGENCESCPYVESCAGGCCEMSLMKTGKLHNDYYCFYSIEKELLGKKNPLLRFFLKITEKTGAADLEKLGRIRNIFLGERK